MTVFTHVVRALGIVALAAGVPTMANAQQRMQLSAQEPYVHPHSGITIPAAVTGIKNRDGRSYAKDDLNVSVSFTTARNAESLTFYVYRVTSGSLPVWFSQAQSSIAARPAYNSPKLAFDIEAITPPGWSSASGLRAIYDTPDSRYTLSTGVAMFKVDEWYVKVRASSATRSSAELRGWMDEAIASITFPEGEAPAVAPIEACPTKLKIRGKSKDVKKDTGASVLGGLLAGLVANQKAKDSEEEADPPAAPVTFCKDHEVEPGRGVYRADASETSYLYAISDSGIGISVGPDTIAQILADDQKGEAQYSVILHLEDRNITYTPQNRMPTPDRAFQIVNKGTAVGTVPTWGDTRTIKINSGALK